MINITIVGTGNVAFHLSEIFLEREGINLMEICGRKNNLPSYFNDKINYSNNLSKLEKSDFYLICIDDDQIENISKNIKIDKHSIILHCSGSTSINVLSILISPLLGRHKPIIKSTNVLFPEPLSPTNAIFSPLLIVRFIFSKITFFW